MNKGQQQYQHCIKGNNDQQDTSYINKKIYLHNQWFYGLHSEIIPVL